MIQNKDTQSTISYSYHSNLFSFYSYFFTFWADSLKFDSNLHTYFFLKESNDLEGLPKEWF